LSRPRRLLRLPDQTFPKGYRLRKRSEYQTIQRHGLREVFPDLIFLWRFSQGQVSRLGITVSRRVAKQAAVRNRIKRWIREAFRQRETTPERPLELVIIARARAAGTTYAAIQEQLMTFWRRVQKSDHAGD
jgi:ribonuclease P protein component